ncbi:MAG: hypothetical protein ACI4VN_02280 [Clostridia bacterium]
MNKYFRITKYNNLLQYSIDSKLKTIAENIISQQSQGIIELKKIQSNLKNMIK